MTKHGDSPIANGDRPALTSEVSEFGESFDRIAGELSQSFERSKNALTLKGLSFCEAYIEGRARIAVEFRANSAIEADGGSLFSIWAYKGHALNAAPGRNSGWGEKGEAVYNHCGLGRDQHVVFVRDVELVNAVEVMPSVLEGLYRIEDKCLDGRSWRASTLFMSVKGGFRTLPVFVEGEECVPVDLASVGFDESAVSMIQGCSEIVDGISHDGRGMLGNTPSQRALFPSVRIGLGAESFDVVSNVSSYDRFELLDVMVGPFYF